MSTSCKFIKTSSSGFDNPTLYRSIVGALQYATIKRPDLAFSVNKVCQYMSNPLEHHWTTVKRILRYLQGSLHMGIQLRPANPSSSLSLTAFCDADWASDPDDRKSISGACLFVDPNIVTWWSKKQQIVSRSNTEVEYRSLALVSQKLIWVESLLSELQFNYQTPLVLCDNLSTVSMAHNPVLHHKTKHIELDLFFVRDGVQSKL
ncbi:putative RNA-directed DNA polymerase [Lupinus albus]|uniref:Putative RNA-directed DNA polymerase n=1 Tax=Lupinus albus TaxID=3870 RepID=A0A6A4NU39_LUPAL|nr:putative RNA-directed DNA polymerase [Lupinus albus]